MREPLRDRERLVHMKTAIERFFELVFDMTSNRPRYEIDMTPT